MKKLIVATALLSAFTFSAARAEEKFDCGSAPQDKWMTEDAMKEKAKTLGLDVRQVKVEDGCYEVYAIDDKGNRVEAVFNPETGERVGAEGAE